jgi:oligogalacturonide lyase
MEMKKVGDLPKGGQITGHLTAANTGRIACSYHLANKYYGLVILDPGKEAEVVYQSDYRLGHAQICPADENLIFYIHETEGDAFQRTWMFDVKERYVRPYYVEHPSEWITHEVWAADGTEMALMKLDPACPVDGEKGETHSGNIIIGDKDGRHFDVVASSTQLLHPCISRDHKWLCADRISYLGTRVQEGVLLIERATGKSRLIATTGHCKTGADHQHPSFNRKGDQILFSNPDENGIAQVCVIDLKQVWQNW